MVDNSMKTLIQVATVVKAIGVMREGIERTRLPNMIGALYIWNNVDRILQSWKSCQREEPKRSEGYWYTFLGRLSYSVWGFNLGKKDY